MAGLRFCGISAGGGRVLTSSGLNTGTEAPAGTGKKGLIRRLIGEPLLQFMVLGAMIFAAHAAVTPAVPKERLIEVTPEVRASIVDAFKASHEGREPGPDEYGKLVDVWILNEITFREALAQGLDKGDEMIRDRIVHKMRLLIFNGVEVKEPTRAELEAWYAKRRAQYDVPETISFISVPFTGPNAEADARATLEQILAGTESDDVQNRALIFGERPRKSLEPSFGAPFVEALVTLPEGEWRVLPSKDGWNVVRLDAYAEGHATDLDEVAAQAALAWKDERRRVLGIAATKDLGKAYVIRRGEP